MEERYGNEEHEEEKDALTQEFDRLVPHHDNLGQILFSDQDSFRIETVQIVDPEGLKKYLDALVEAGIIADINAPDEEEEEQE